jgi:hypothetical protein
MNSSLSPERRSEIMLTNISKSDCGVIAAQAVTKLSRAAAESLVVEHGDYEYGVGISRGALNRALQHAGYVVTPIEFDRGSTAATFVAGHEWGTYLIYTDTHVMALVEGDLFNGSGDWHSPVEEAYIVVDGKSSGTS